MTQNWNNSKDSELHRRTAKHERLLSWE